MSAYRSITSAFPCLIYVALVHHFVLCCEFFYFSTSAHVPPPLFSVVSSYPGLERYFASIKSLVIIYNPTFTCPLSISLLTISSSPSSFNIIKTSSRFICCHDEILSVNDVIFHACLLYLFIAVLILCTSIYFCLKVSGLIS